MRIGNRQLQRTFLIPGLILLSLLTVTPSISPVRGEQLASDGSAGLFGKAYGGSGATSVSLFLTTTRSNDLIVITGLLAPSATMLSVTDASGLVFIERVHQEVSVFGNYKGVLFEWYAVSASPLSSDNIKINWDINSDQFVIIAYAIAGVNVHKPFESSPNVGTTVNASATGSFSSKGGRSILLMNAFCSHDCRGTPMQPSNFNRMTVVGEYLNCVPGHGCGSHLPFFLEDVSFRVVSGGKSSYAAVEDGLSMVDYGHGITWNILAETLRAAH